MTHAVRLLFAVLIAALLTACGGGSDPQPATPQAAVTALRAQAKLMASVPVDSAARQLMDLGESQFPQYFPGHPATQSAGPFLYRYYAETGIYLGVVVQADAGYEMNGVYVMGGAFGNDPTYVGPLANFITPVELPVLTGSVATGAAVPLAQVTVTDSTGANACSSDVVTADATGAYNCSLRQSAQPPFVVTAVDPAGLAQPMVSLTTVRPETGAAATVNVTPITTAIAAQLAPNKDPFALTSDSSALAAVTTESLDAVKTNVATQLAPVLTALGVNAATFDPVSTPFTAGSNTGVDQMLDQVKVSYENGSPVLANVLNPDAAPVPMADAATSSPPTVAASTVASGFGTGDLNVLKARFESCFAVASASRVGHPSCSGISVDDAPTDLTGGATYLHNGFGATVAFGGLLASADMDGAKFNQPELLRYVTRQDGRDEVVVNLKFVDKNGVGDNRILVLKKFAGTASQARPTDWWAYGNQRPLNLFVRASVRRQEQMLPDSFLSTFNAGTSRYQTGLEIFIAKPCTNTTSQCPNSTDIRYVRVKGPGLPDAGLVYGDVNLPQSWMAIINATGTIPSGDQQYGSGSNNIFYLQRTMGITGTASFAIRPNPFVSQSSPSYNSWAHPAMYGETPSSTWAFDLSKVPAWSSFTFEVFRGSATTTTETYTASIITPVVPATSGAQQQWHTIPSHVKALASDGAPAATSLTLDWTINSLAQRVDSINIYSWNGTSAVNSASTLVAKGATSGTATAVGGTFVALTTQTPPYVSRTLQWRYKMLDGSYKDHTVIFN